MTGSPFPQYTDRFRRLATTAVFASLLSYAVVLLITPASNDEIARTYHASLGELGELSLATMLGFFVTVIPAGRLSDKRGKLPSMATGCLCMTAGALLFARATDFGLAIAGAALLGIGGGFSEATSMALLADLHSNSRRTSMMNLAQAMFGVGAVISPFGIGWLLASGLSWRLGYVGAAAICAAGAGLNIVALAMRQERPIRQAGERGVTRRLLSDSLVWWLCVGILLYVGAEIGQSTWLSIYFRRCLGAEAAPAARSPLFMWVGIGLGRVAAAWASRHLGENALLCCSTGLAALSQAALLLAGGPPSGTVSALALGFFLGPVFPTVVSRAAAAYQRASGAVSSVVIAAGSLGAALVPPIIGWAGDAVGLRPALWICFGVLVADMAVFVRLGRPDGSASDTPTTRS